MLFSKITKVGLPTASSNQIEQDIKLILEQ
jgi:hypothetical protein